MPKLTPASREAPPVGRSAAASVPAAEGDRHAAVMGRRMEIKYLINRTTRTALARDVAAFATRDRASRDGPYRIRSLYFDTFGYQAYHQKLAGLPLRYKLRLRVYGDDPARDATFVRVEIKYRRKAYIHKRSADVPREDYPALQRALFDHQALPEHLLADPAVREFVRLQRQLGMEPKVVVEYRREAFERRELGRVRLSFDDRVYASRDLDLFGRLSAAVPLLRYDHAVFEAKVDGVLPYWLHMLIGKYDLANRAFSKYCYAVRGQACLSPISREVVL